jgi:colicin import membrane protein
MSGEQVFDRFGEREEPGLGRSILFAFSVHVVLLAALFVGIRWQSHRPQAVEVELWEAPAAPRVQEAEPPKPAPEPPKPEIVRKPEPRMAEPDIAIKARKEPKLKVEDRLKRKPEPKPKPKPKPEPVRKATPKPSPDAARAKAEYEERLRAELAREQAALRAEREETEMRELLARSASAARSKALADYQAKIRAKVRGNIILPHDIEGNPEAVFDVVQLPTGEVLSVNLRKSSGNKGYDEAVERAILKASPLPKPDQPDVFDRVLIFSFRPQDK